MQTDHRYVTIKSPVSFKTQFTTNGANFQWDLAPLEIIMFCEPVRQQLLEIGAIEESAQWESFVEIHDSEWRPEKRIAITNQPKEDILETFHTFLNLIQGHEPKPDLLHKACIPESLLFRIKELATQTQATMGGKVLSAPLRICLDHQELEIAGRIKKPSQKIEQFNESRYVIIANVDAPSTWTRTIQIQTKEGPSRMTLNIDTRRFLNILHIAQSTQRPCKIHVLETVDAKFNKIKIVEHVELIDDDLDF